MEYEILFRGKRLDNGEWAYGLLTIMGGQYHIIDLDDENTAYPVDQSTVGRYTGRTDKNGVKVYEGDILWTNEDVFAEAFVVKYGRCGGVQNVKHEVGYVGFYVEPVGRDAAELLRFGIRTDILYLLNACEMEVVGNIHDNPELLGGAE